MEGFACAAVELREAFGVGNGHKHKRSNNQKKVPPKGKSATIEASILIFQVLADHTKGRETPKQNHKEIKTAQEQVK
eukprot:2451889-Amphidinium_carterae.1